MQKKAEQERRLRNIELQKKTIAGKIDAEMKQEYDNYDDMLRRKRDQTLEAQEQTAALRNRLNERKERIKARPAMEGLSKEEQEAMMKNYE